MSTKPRNPRYFPNMKVRGARRRRLAPFHRMAGSIDQMQAAFRRLTNTSLLALAETNPNRGGDECLS